MFYNLKSNEHYILIILVIFTLSIHFHVPLNKGTHLIIQVIIMDYLEKLY